MDISTICKRVDGSYVINGIYHVPNDSEFSEQYAACVAWEEKHPGSVRIEQEYTPQPPTLEYQLAEVEAEYAPKISALQTALVAATLTDGPIMDGNIASLRTEWVALLNAKSSAIEALLI